MADPPPPAAPQVRGEGALSPLSGSYLLIVVAEPKTDQHKDVILNRISKGKFVFGVCASGAANSWSQTPPNQFCHVRPGIRSRVS